MAGQYTNTLALQSIPDIAGPIVVSAEKNTAGDRECDGCYTTQDIVVRKGIEFPVCSYIEQAARCVIRTCCERISIWEKPWCLLIMDKP
jgi:hypothetical protein